MDAQVTDSAADSMSIPSWKEVPDYFIWDAFNWASRERERDIGSGAKQQELLLAETKNFYVIPDQFGVVAGHLLVLPKARVTSIAGLGSDLDGETRWLVDHVSHVLTTEYDAKVVIAEHGECGCATAGQAHIHALPVPNALTPEGLEGIIDKVLARRMVGIERILYRGAEFTALEDLQALINADGAEIIGRVLKCADLASDGAYPATARTASGLARPYVYFAGPGVRFISMCSLRSQFVREVVSTAAGQSPGVWDRRVHTSRTNMFATFAGLAPGFGKVDVGMHGFRARGEKAHIAFLRPAEAATPDADVSMTAVADRQFTGTA